MILTLVIISGDHWGREAGSRVCTKSAVTEVSPAPAPGNTHSVVCSLCLLTGIRNLSTSHLTLDHNYIALMSANTAIAIITITLFGVTFKAVLIYLDVDLSGGCSM